MNKQELIDKAVEDLNGIWSSPGMTTEWYVRPGGVMASKNHCEVITKEEFTKRARELGYINGYKWGVEYETNGKKPDLPRNVIVDVNINGEWKGAGYPSDAVWTWNWDNITAFSIVDERYKPVEVEPAKLMQDGENNQTFKVDMAGPDWYDYDKQQAVALPPVGEQCEWKGFRGGKWVACEVIDKYQDKEMVVFNTGEYRNCKFEILQIDSVEFRPLDWNRKADEGKRKFVEAAKVAHGNFAYTEVVAEAMYKSGLFELKNKAAS